MRYISTKEYNSRMKQIQAENAARERRQALRNEKKKYRPFHMMMEKMKTSNKVLFAAILAIIVFTASCLYIQLHTSTEVSSTLITRWYGFWTVEIVALAGIKVSKVIRNNQTDDDTEIESENDEAVG